jgi:dipeptidase
VNPKKFFMIIGILFLSLGLFGAFSLTDSQGEQDECLITDSPSEGCTVIIVGKNASVDGSVITTHTCDCGVCDWTWRYIPAADHKPGSMRKIYHINQFKTFPPEEGLKWDVVYEKNFTGLEIPQLEHTYAYMHGAFGYMNDQQLAIGESTIGSRPKMNNLTGAPKFDITMLTLLAMERCKTAREAIKLMGSLAEEHGYGHTDYGEMLAVADPDEVWIFEIMPVGSLWNPKIGKPGAIWCAQRVPDDHVSVCPNESRIGEIDLNKPDYFMASPNVTSYAVENGYYDPESGEPFNWKKAYSPTEGSANSTHGWHGRLWRFFDLVAPSKKFSPDVPNMDFPFSVKPDKKLSVEDVMRLTRDKYEGTHFDLRETIQAGPFSNPNYLTRPYKFDGKTWDTKRFISDNRAEYVTVTQSRGWLPNPVGGIVWLAWGAQDTSCFMPLYGAGITGIPKSFEIGDHFILDRNSARWAFDYVGFHTQVAYSLAIEDVKKAREKWEKSALKNTAAIDKAALELYKQDPDLAREFLTTYCLNNAERVIKAWWELGDQLLVKYNHLFIYNPETRERKTIQYPDWWLRIIIEQQKLEPRSVTEHN